MESSVASIAPDMPLPDQENIRSVPSFVDTDADVQEAEEVEDLPVLRPKEEDAEAVEELHGGDAEEDNNNEKAVNYKTDGTNENNKNADASQKDYHSIKKAAKDKIAALAGTEILVVSPKKKLTYLEAKKVKNKMMMAWSNYLFKQFVAFSHFKDFRRFVPFIYADESLKGKDVWWEFAGAVDGFNLFN